MDILKILKGGDLRSIGNARIIVDLVKDQKTFDELFKGLFEEDRLIVMRAADAIEKITLNNTDYLQPHKEELMKLLERSKNKELQWHLSLLVPRLQLSKQEEITIAEILKRWVVDKDQSRIVRVNSIQGLYELSKNCPEIKKDLINLVKELKTENIASINARLRKLKM